MGLLVLFVAALIAAAVFWFLRPKTPDLTKREGEDDDAFRERSGLKNMRMRRLAFTAGSGISVLVAFGTLIGTSIVHPGGGQVGLIEKKFLCKPNTRGTYLARQGECGRQAEMFMPGFRFLPFYNVFNKVTYEDMVTVPEGAYATLSARDGLPQPDGQAAAPNWSQEEAAKMLDATYFLNEGKGVKGPQSAILKPATYPINTYLWDVNTTAGTRTEISTGFVGTVRSAVEDNTVPEFFKAKAGQETKDCGLVREAKAGTLKARLVNVGCLGVWAEALPAGSYFINTNVYEVTEVDVRMQTSEYKGGYTRRSIDLTVSEETGTITQEAPKELDIPVPADATGDALQIKVEGWTLPQELRTQWRIDPNNAPLVTAAIGGLKDVENKIITPGIRSIARNVGGSSIRVKNTVAYNEALAAKEALELDLARLENPAISDVELKMSAEQRASRINDLKRRLAGYDLPDPDEEIERPTLVLDFQDNREILERLIREDMFELGTESGVEIVSVRLGNVDIPAELLIARKREQLAGQQERAFNQIRKAEIARQASEAERELANKQSEIVAAQVSVQVAEQTKQQQLLLGQAQRAFDEEAAQGRKAQALVLGEDRVAMLQALEMGLKAVGEKPELLKILPEGFSTLILGGNNDGGLTNLGAMLKEIGGLPTAPRSGATTVNE